MRSIISGGIIALALLLAMMPWAGVLGEGETEVEVNTQVRHYLLLGQDTYADEVQSDARTDTIVLVTLDSKYKRIIMTSILRDSKIKNPRGNETKINNIYKFYGLEGLVSCIERELDINVSGSVLINYENIKPLIDALGGVDIEIDTNEYLQICSILLHKDPNLPKGPGMTHMTGRIALAYMRDRSSGSGDFSRTERQRKVFNELLKKCRQMTLADLSEVYNAVSGGFETDMNALEMLMVFQSGYTLLDGDVVEHTIPVNKTYSYGTIGTSSVLDVRWEKNKTLLHDIFNTPPAQ